MLPGILLPLGRSLIFGRIEYRAFFAIVGRRRGLSPIEALRDSDHHLVHTHGDKPAPRLLRNALHAMQPRRIHPLGKLVASE